MKKIIEKNGRTFECYCSPEFRGTMCCVSIWEVVRPKWIIFRSTYRNYRTFWISDYNTITEGIEDMVNQYLTDEAEENAIQAKWDEVEEDD